MKKHEKEIEKPDPAILEKFQARTQEFQTLMTYYRSAIREVETKFQILADESALLNDRNPVNDIQTRLKSPQSILEKLERKGLSLCWENIENEVSDVAGVRVVCPFIDDIDRLAGAFLEQDDVHLIRKKDYIRHPKENGYRSLHLIIETPIYLMHEKKMMKVEVQLRTIAMEFWASLEHQMRYKKDLSDELIGKLSSQLRGCAAISANLDEQMQSIRNRIDQETIEQEEDYRNVIK